MIREKIKFVSLWDVCVCFLFLIIYVFIFLVNHVKSQHTKPIGFSSRYSLLHVDLAISTKIFSSVLALYPSGH